jgi:hypothetical protein
VAAHREQSWLIGSSRGSQGAVVAHREQWWLIREQCWLIGRSRGSLVATLDCETAVLG